MAAEVANPLRILSAYLTTTATISPPPDCNKIANHTAQSYPKKKPFSVTAVQSLNANVIKPVKHMNKYLVSRIGIHNTRPFSPQMGLHRIVHDYVTKKVVASGACNYCRDNMIC